VAGHVEWGSLVEGKAIVRFRLSPFPLTPAPNDRPISLRQGLGETPGHDYLLIGRNPARRSAQ
jgi:hypothetical protein